jgi:hypothetical protein
MLNEYQRRSLKVTLSIVEKSLRDIEKILNENDHKGVLYTFSNNIPPTAKEKVLLLISKVYRTIKNVAEKFNLGKESKYANREAFAKLPHCWEMLEDTKAKKLKRYGDVPAGLDNVLNPELDIIIKFITEMEYILRDIK